MPDKSQIFLILFLMLGPFKIIGPFVKITKNADPALTRKIAVRSILYSIAALVLAAFLGENILKNYNIPVPILALSAGIILFLVALLNVISQFKPTMVHEEHAGTPSLAVAMNPLAFPTIVTPYGIAAVIVFMALSPDLNSKLIIGVFVLVIMALNLIFMLVNKYIFKVLVVVLPILGAIIGVVQVALGVKVIYNSITQLLTMN